jgi:hypothetical protein
MQVKTAFRVEGRWDIIKQIMMHFAKAYKTTFEVKLIDARPTHVLTVITPVENLPLVRGLPGVIEISTPQEYKDGEV